MDFQLELASLKGIIEVLERSERSKHVVAGTDI